MKRFVCVVIVLLLLLCGCGKEEIQAVPPGDFSEYYTEVLSVWRTGTEEELNGFLYYAKPEYREFGAGLFENAAETEIKTWEKINDDLWEVTAFIRLEGEEEGTDCYHFVGRIDGALKVMIGRHNVPESLKQGADLSRFSYENELPMDQIDFTTPA